MALKATRTHGRTRRGGIEPPGGGNGGRRHHDSTTTRLAEEDKLTAGRGAGPLEFEEMPPAWLDEVGELFHRYCGLRPN